MKDLIQKYKDLSAEAESTKDEIGELLKPVIRIFNSNPEDVKYIEDGDILSIIFLEVRDSDFMASWTYEGEYSLEETSGYNVIPFSIFDSDDYVENAKSLIKNKEREKDMERLERAKRHLKNSIEEIASLEKKLEESV